jgi:hypothetical protein
MPIGINRAPVLTLWATVVAEQLGRSPDTALTLGRPVAGSAARVKARNIGREERKTDRDADTPGLAVPHVTAPVPLLGETIRLLPTTDGELRAADGDVPADPAAAGRRFHTALMDWLRRQCWTSPKSARPDDPAGGIVDSEKERSDGKR